MNINRWEENHGFAGVPETSPRIGRDPVLSLILPCYNEEEILPSTLTAIDAFLTELRLKEKIAQESFALYVDDGSRDATWSLIEDFAQTSSSCAGLKLAGNVGHQNALLAGMLEVPSQVDCVITLDADLQDDVFVVEDMLQAFSEGKDIVYGVRKDRSSDSPFKRITAGCYYRLMLKLGVNLVPQHADFRLIGRNVLDALKNYPEKNIFLRGLFPSMGFQTAKVFYARRARTLGVTKYPLSKMLSFAWQGITSFSSRPLRWVSIAGICVMFLSLVYALSTLYVHFKGMTVPGWTTLAAGMFFLGATQLLSIAVLGEYIAKIYTEVKNRPRYIKETTTKQRPLR
jgi:glycosyltransferase involved in cell wall biosynthesis